MITRSFCLRFLRSAGEPDSVHAALFSVIPFEMTGSGADGVPWTETVRQTPASPRLRKVMPLSSWP